MRLKIRTVNRAALLTSVISTSLMAALGILAKVHWWWLPTACSVMFFVTYVSARCSFRSYVLLRIKPLYQLLLSRDIHASRLSEELRKRVKDDIVDDIQQALDHLVEFGETEMERLKQKEKERSEFLTAVFHELRTPIFNIEGYTQTLLDGGLDDPQVNRKFLERTVRSIDRLSALVEDVERISRYESGGQVMYKDIFDIMEVVHEVIDVNIIRSRDNEVTVIVETDAFPRNRPVMVYADKLRISQVIDKLLINAITYSNRGGTVTVGFVDMFDKILVEIRDRGLGIPAKDIPRVFDMFYRVDKSRSRDSGGSGLGLYGVKGILDSHGESITVRSELGKGSTFSFTVTKAGNTQKPIQRNV